MLTHAARAAVKQLNLFSHSLAAKGSGQSNPHTVQLHCRFTTYRHRFARVAPAPRAKLEEIQRFNSKIQRFNSKIQRFNSKIQRIVDVRRPSNSCQTLPGQMLPNVAWPFYLRKNVLERPNMKNFLVTT